MENESAKDGAFTLAPPARAGESERTLRTHMAIIVDLVKENNKVIPIIVEHSGPSRGADGNYVTLPRKFYDTDNIYISHVSIIFISLLK